MQCPVDGETLLITERSGVEIDYCPRCRGVWLDRGELDKIIDAAAASATPPPPPRDTPRRDHDNRRDDRKPKKKRVESFLGELFDF